MTDQDDASHDIRRAAKSGAIPAGLTRRALLGGVGGASVALAGAPLRLPGLVPAVSAETAPTAPAIALKRHERAYQIRVQAAERLKELPLPSVGPIGDEELYPTKIGNFSKGLPHDGLGEPNPFAYAALATAVASGEPAAFEDIPMGGAARLRNPLAGLAFDLVGADSHQLTIRRPPAFASAEAAAEMGELYWQTLTRDIHFARYNDDPVTTAAAADLSTFSDFRGPKTKGRRVTLDTLFRAGMAGVRDGPFVSQFLLKDCPTGARIATQQIRTLLPVDHLVTVDEWLVVQDGQIPAAALLPVYDPIPRYIRNGRDLAEAVHWDWPGQAAHNAALIACGAGGVSLAGVFAGATNAPMDPGNPYLSSRTQGGFATFDLAQVTYLVGLVANSALKAAWYQKWFRHRRLRPEEFGGRVHHTVAGSAGYPVHGDLLAGSAVLDEIGRRFGTHLLPQAYPEGCPIHPAYPSGHATWAGATITVLKAFFDESAVMANPVVAAGDGLSLVPYTGVDADRLTLGGELNKLAWNIAIGRNFAGIHWRTDAIEGLRLGEAVAIRVLADLRETYREDFGGYTLTTFDGAAITV